MKGFCIISVQCISVISWINIKIVIHKEKEISICHKLLSGVSERKIKETSIKFPCGQCGKKCIDVESVWDPKFEDFSVGCDNCNKWYNYICVDLDGNEPELQDGSCLPYYCPTCRTTFNENPPKKGKGKKSSLNAKAKDSLQCHAAVSSPAASDILQTGLRCSTRVRKPVNCLDT